MTPGPSRILSNENILKWERGRSGAGRGQTSRGTTWGLRALPSEGLGRCLWLTAPTRLLRPTDPHRREPAGQMPGGAPTPGAPGPLPPPKQQPGWKDKARIQAHCASTALYHAGLPQSGTVSGQHAQSHHALGPVPRATIHLSGFQGSGRTQAVLQLLPRRDLAHPVPGGWWAAEGYHGARRYGQKACPHQPLSPCGKEEDGLAEEGVGALAGRALGQEPASSAPQDLPGRPGSRRPQGQPTGQAWPCLLVKPTVQTARARGSLSKPWS